MIEFRVLTPDDWRSWRGLRLAALAEAPEAFGAVLADWQGEGDREERWRARLAGPGSYNVIAVLDGRPAGMVSGILGPRGEGAELISLWVRPAARGRGVADLLIGEVGRWAARERAGSLRLSVKQANGHAVALYRRNGFAPAGEPVAAAGRAAGERVMVKALGPSRSGPVGPRS